MTGIYIMLGGMVLFTVIVVGLDWLGRRQQRRRNSVTATKQ